MSNLYIIKQRFIEHITLVQQVAVSNILEQIAESAIIIKNSLKKRQEGFILRQRRQRRRQPASGC